MKNTVLTSLLFVLLSISVYSQNFEEASRFRVSDTKENNSSVVIEYDAKIKLEMNKNINVLNNFGVPIGMLGSHVTNDLGVQTGMLRSQQINDLGVQTGMLRSQQINDLGVQTGMLR